MLPAPEEDPPCLPQKPLRGSPPEKATGPLNRWRSVLVHPLDQALYELQRIDSRIISLERESRDLDPGKRELARLSEIEAERSQVADRLGQTEGEIREAEGRLKTIEEKHNSHRRRLLSGEVKNPKELEALRVEVDSLARTRGTLEERILALMEQVDAVRPQMDEIEARLEKARKTYQVKSGHFAQRKRELEEELDALRAARGAAAAQIDPATLKRYQGITERRGGVAVERVVGNSTEACRTTLPDQVVRTLRAAEGFQFCEECGRFLVFIAD